MWMSPASTALQNSGIVYYVVSSIGPNAYEYHTDAFLNRQLTMTGPFVYLPLSTQGWWQRDIFMERALEQSEQY